MKSHAFEEVQTPSSAASFADFSQYLSAAEWRATPAAKRLFPTETSFSWFTRRHREELIRSRGYLPRAGSAGSLVHPARLEAAIIEILHREAEKRLADDEPPPRTA